MHLFSLQVSSAYHHCIDKSTLMCFLNLVSGKQCVVYKCVVEESAENFSAWLNESCETYNHHCFTLVGAASSSLKVKFGLPEASLLTKNHNTCSFGSVCIPERHTSKMNEHANMVRKMSCGSEWFITQGIFAADPVIKLLSD
jgi:hypothetical protein